MSSIKIYNDTIQFDSSFDLPTRDKSWTLDFKDIAVIGLINRMEGDDDSDFLLLIDKKLNKYFLSLTKGIIGWDIALHEFVRYFKIDLNTPVTDNAVILYPKEIVNQPLYKKSFATTTKTFFGATHVADGELSDEVTSKINA